MTTSTVTARRKGDPQHYVEGKKCKNENYPASEHPNLVRYLSGGGSDDTGGYRSRGGTRGGMPETKQKGEIKGGYKSRPGARGGMPRTEQTGRRKGAYKSRL